MTINDAEAARLAASNHFMAAGFSAGISIDLARRYTDEGGTAILSTGGVPLLTLPSGTGVRDWLEALKSDPTAEHLFSPPVTPTLAVAKAKAPMDKTLSADERLSLANGHAALRPVRTSGKA